MRWEYQTIAAHPEDSPVRESFLRELQQLGDEGWEVVASMPSGRDDGRGDVILKRSKR